MPDRHREGSRVNEPEISLGDQFAVFADEVREQAEADLAAGLEGWPDDDWTGL